ncbi:MAG: hypothetical protein KGJ60_14710 [Verrucomicrobiota bacterium]|nr:hypothetical protein [Verrucomicrobiota bacterium]
MLILQNGRVTFVPMRRFLTCLLLLAPLCAALASGPVGGRVLKVLPLLLDLQGRDALSPSLFDRDAYQAQLRERTNDVSGVRFDVLWKASHARGQTLKLRVELRGIGARSLPTWAALEQTVRPGFFRHWASLTLGGADYKRFGRLIAWRATLWEGGKMLGEQQSFLW